jgi:hypothetical protein
MRRESTLSHDRSQRTACRGTRKHMKPHTLMLRSAIPLRNASHGIEIAQTLNRLYAGISSVVSVADHSTVLDYSEIRRIALADEAPKP